VFEVKVFKNEHSGVNKGGMNRYGRKKNSAKIGGGE
jgi:hypothetical protein